MKGMMERERAERINEQNQSVLLLNGRGQRLQPILEQSNESGSYVTERSGGRDAASISLLQP